jgi:predicted esterase YcpF (UPF0227 family)
MNIIYLHGFNSDGNSTTIKTLRESFPELISISYDYINADIAFEEINSLIERTLKMDEELLIAGTSLGGFWANYFAQKFQLKCVIVNPAMQPSESLKKAVGPSPIKNYNSGEEKIFTSENAPAYKKYEVEILPGISRTIVLGKNDDVIDYKITEEAFRGKGEIIITEQGHRITDHSKIVDIITKAAAIPSLDLN